MKNPAHPGRIVRSACLEPLGLSVTEGAKVLGVSRQTLTKIINGRSGISPEMAIRLSKAFGSTPETWLRMQLAYDLATAPEGRGQNQGAPSARPSRIADELTRPGRFTKVHTLAGGRKGTWSLSVTRNRRLTFSVDDESEICDLNLEDYH
ncbi:MAG TPA: HigA family addiction module antitoxin [Bryobacteraceae bacterium]|nr:HigA family addiction module antitoxin [Bryobacteraceae bacterium]